MMGYTLVICKQNATHHLLAFVFVGNQHPPKQADFSEKHDACTEPKLFAAWPVERWVM
jgi:hypothetical protein